MATDRQQVAGQSSLTPEERAAAFWEEWVCPRNGTRPLCPKGVFVDEFAAAIRAAVAEERDRGLTWMRWLIDQYETCNIDSSDIDPIIAAFKSGGTPPPC